MIRKNKIRLVIALVVAAIVLVPTLISYDTEPQPLAPNPKLWNYFEPWVSAHLNTSKNIIKLSLLNLTQDGNKISMGYLVDPNENPVVNDSGTYGSLWIIGHAGLWIQDESLSTGYTSMSIIDNNFTLSVNGPFLKNLSSSHWNNILPYLGPYGAYGGIIPGNNSLGFRAVTNPADPWTTSASDQINSGNYTFVFTWTFTPVFEVGPYYFDGTPENFSFQWSQEWIT